jgi:hypothetical protein
MLGILYKIVPAFTTTKAMLEKLGLTPAATTLLAVPQKEKGKAVPHTTVYHANAVHQAESSCLFASR